MESERQQEELDEQEQLAVDSVVAVHKNGMEGTAKVLAGLLGVVKHYEKRIS